MSENKIKHPQEEFWADEARSDALRELAPTGMRLREIAIALTTKFKVTFSPGKVSGRARRLGISIKGRPQESTSPRAPRAKPIVRPRPPVDAANAPVSRRLSVFDLTERDCRWIAGDPRLDANPFCGAPTRAEGESYCPHHASIAYRPIEDRKKPASTRIALRRAA